MGAKNVIELFNLCLQDLDLWRKEANSYQKWNRPKKCLTLFLYFLLKFYKVHKIHVLILIQIYNYSNLRFFDNAGIFLWEKKVRSGTILCIIFHITNGLNHFCLSNDMKNFYSSFEYLFSVILFVCVTIFVFLTHFPKTTMVNN